MSSFGIPPSERVLKAVPGPLVKTGEKVAGQKQPKALEYFKVLDARGELIPEFNNRPEELEIELVSDDIRDFWRDRLNCYDGRTCLCFNDTGGQTALRRSKSGVFQPVECNPARCALRLNETRKPTPEDSKAGRLTEYQQEIMERYSKVYDWAHFTPDTRCKSQTYLLFALPHPKEPGQYITRPGEYARYTSGSSNINNQLLKGLKDIHDRVRGRMKGLRVKLVMSFTANAYGGHAPTVGIVGPTDKELPQAIAEMSRRRALTSLDMDAAMSALAQLTVEELAAVDAEYLYTHFYCGENEALPEPQHTLALPAPRERTEVTFGTSDPRVIALIEKCRLGYEAITKLQMRFGENVTGYIEYLEDHAAKNNIDISTVRARADEVSGVKQSLPPQETVAPALLSSDEFSEVPDDPDETFADLKAKFDFRKDT